MSEIQNTGKTLTSAFLPKNICTRDFSVRELILENPDTIPNKIVISPHGFVCVKSDMDTHQWVKYTRIANGVHEHNAILVRSYGSYLKLKVVKDIKVDEEILLWFSEEVQSMMGISYLGLENIQGSIKFL